MQQHLLGIVSNNDTHSGPELSLKASVYVTQENPQQQCGRGTGPQPECLIRSIVQCKLMFVGKITSTPAAWCFFTSYYYSWSTWAVLIFSTTWCLDSVLLVNFWCIKPAVLVLIQSYREQEGRRVWIGLHQRCQIEYTRSCSFQFMCYQRLSIASKHANDVILQP